MHSKVEKCLSSFSKQSLYFRNFSFSISVFYFQFQFPLFPIALIVVVFYVKVISIIHEKVAQHLAMTVLEVGINFT